MKISTKARFATVLALSVLITASASPIQAKNADNVFAMRQSVGGKIELKNSAPKNPNPGPKVFVIEQNLAEFLRQAARRDGYEITLSKKVRGVIRKAEMSHQMEAILKKLSGQFDLKWHFQGRQVYVSVGSETTSRMIFLGAMRFKDLEAAMQDSGISSQHNKLSYVKESNSVLVHGPVSYIANIELLADSYNKKKNTNTNSIKVIRFGTIGN